MNRFLIALLGAFLLMQPVSGHADEVLQKNGIELKKKARDMRAKNAGNAKALQKKRTNIAANAKAAVESTDGCCGCTVILPSDFGVDSATTYVIATPGVYKLQEDVVFFPADEFTPAINILSDNVTLDLCQHTLSQGNDTPNAFGVQIGEGYFFAADPDFVLKNIEVTNGNIVDFTGVGVFCYNPSFDGPTAELAFEDLRFLGLNILHCGASPTNNFGSGIDLDSAASGNLYDLDLPVAYKNVIIKECNVNRCLGNSAITVSTADDLIITHTTANDLTSTTSTVFDVFDFGPSAYLITCRNLQMNHCQGNNTQDLDPNVPDALSGSEIQGCINVYVSNCQFNDTFGTSDTITATFLSNTQGVFENCQFNDNRGGEFVRAVHGIHLSDDTFQQTSANGLKFINCQFNGSSISPESTRTPIGRARVVGAFAITLRNVVFDRCQACNIDVQNPNFHAFGYFIATAAEDPTPEFANVQNIIFTNCVASDISTLGYSAAGFFLGAVNINRVGEQAQLLNMVVENCIAERIHSSTSTFPVAGIAEAPFAAIGDVETQFPLEKNLFIRNCRVSDVRAGAGNPLSAGILVESVQNPVIENNSVSDSDRGILFTGTNDIIPNGFQLAATRQDALASPPVPIDIGTPVGPSQFESFKNKTRKDTVQVLVPDDVDADHEFLFPTTSDLTALHWKSGDKIVYNANGGPVIPGLVDGQTYYVIVYIPGFTERGLVLNNNVGNCSVSGYQDDRRPTESAWINNIALLNGTKPSHKANFAIFWPNKKPQVDEGTLGQYPKCPNKNFNTSLIYAKKKSHHSGR